MSNPKPDYLSELRLCISDDVSLLRIIEEIKKDARCDVIKEIITKLNMLIERYKRLEKDYYRMSEKKKINNLKAISNSYFHIKNDLIKMKKELLEREEK